MLGIIAKQKGNLELALKLIETALGQRTEMPLGWHNRALLLRMLNRPDEALQSARQAVDLDPNFAEAWNLISFLLRDQRDFDGARNAEGRAVAIEPGNAGFLGNYATLLYAMGDTRSAYDAMRRAERIDPAIMPQTMGNILKAAGYPERAVPYFEKACTQLPDNDELRSSHAMARLLIGDFAEGWRLWETRPSLDARFAHVPFWNGQPVDHLLLHEDQGIGDTFQCARYISLLKPYAKHLTLQVTAVVHRLLTANFPDLNVITLDDPVPPVDAHIRLLSLPAFFKAKADNIPANIPYISASETSREAWRTRLANIRAPRIGLVWGGNPDHLNDRQRSIPFAQLAALLASPGHFVSLQKGAYRDPTALASVGIYDTDSNIKDFSDTASLMAELDLLITVDTSVAHLAGAMGKPVWLLLPFDPDWRWMLGREDTPWYPTMRLFRQPEPRNWQPVIARVAADLQRFIAGDRLVVQPRRWKDPCLRQNPQAINLPE
jgi:Tfp pilus assembly protein PilF